MSISPTKYIKRRQRLVGWAESSRPTIQSVAMTVGLEDSAHPTKKTENTTTRGGRDPIGCGGVRNPRDKSPFRDHADTPARRVGPVHPGRSESNFSGRSNSMPPHQE